MAGNSKGELLVTAGGKEYRLHFGMSVIGDLQAKHGEKLEAILGGRGGDALPNMNVVVDMILGALQRYHGAEADRWLVDDIVAENFDLLPKLLTTAFPDAPKDGEEGNGKAAP